MCRNKLTRKFIVPKTSIFDPRGVYVLKTADVKDEIFSKNKNGLIRCNSKYYENRANGRALDTVHPLYLWKGKKRLKLNVIPKFHPTKFDTSVNYLLPQVEKKYLFLFDI